MQSWLKINFRDIRKNQKASTVPTRLRGLCERKREREREEGGGFFFLFFSLMVSLFPLLKVISQRHQRARC